MRPDSIIRGAAADGVALAISAAGNIRAKGDRLAVIRWAQVVRQHKQEILNALRRSLSQLAPQVLDRDAFEERAAIMEYDGGLPRHESERFAAEAQRWSLPELKRRRWLN